MPYDFDSTIDRSSTCSYKWNRYKNNKITPMWVADSDFRSPPEVLDTIRARIDHGILGYTNPVEFESGKDAVIRWLKSEYGWTIKPDWIVWTPGVVSAFNVACKAYCDPGDQVLVQTPNYSPIRQAPELNQLQRVDIPTHLVNGRWVLDFELLEEKAANPRCKLLILCNPMNPCGTVLSREELEHIGNICTRYNVVVCSDEIHCDLILNDELKHVPASSLPQMENESLTLMSAAKTFNIAGLGTAFAIIPDAGLRSRFNRSAAGIVPWANILGLIATEAAFRYCKAWQLEQIRYLRNNRNLLVNALNTIDGLSVAIPDATFLAWVNTSNFHAENPIAFFESCGIGPSPGSDFGDENFLRINFACPQSYIINLISRLDEALFEGRQPKYLR